MKMSNVSTNGDLTPYDTGKRAEPRRWEDRHFESEEDWGKVDFDAEDSFTLATLYIERNEDGSYALRGYTNVPLRVEIESNDPTDPDITVTMDAADIKLNHLILMMDDGEEDDDEVHGGRIH